MKRATKKETETRVAHAAELVLEGQAHNTVTSFVAKNITFQDVEQGKSLLVNTFL
tara:strand:- start:375 stop:539 length:165 start_codon:yes stop_codon:yes gene_type:complete